MNCKKCGSEITSDMKFCSECGETNEIAEIVNEATVEKAQKNSNRAMTVVSMILGIVSVAFPLYMALWCGLSLFGVFAWAYWIATVFVGIVGIVAVFISARLSKKATAEKNPERIFLKVAKITRIFGLLLSIAAVILPVILMILYVGLVIIALVLYILTMILGGL